MQRRHSAAAEPPSGSHPCGLLGWRGLFRCRRGGGLPAALSVSLQLLHRRAHRPGRPRLGVALRLGGAHPGRGARHLFQGEVKPPEFILVVKDAGKPRVAIHLRQAVCCGYTNFEQPARIWRLLCIADRAAVASGLACQQCFARAGTHSAATRCASTPQFTLRRGKAARQLCVSDEDGQVLPRLADEKCAGTSVLQRAAPQWRGRSSVPCPWRGR